jgi:hypothetical protein
VKHSDLAKAAALLVTVVLLVILFSQINLSDVVTTLASIDPLYLVLGFLLYTCSYFFRALRFHILLNREVGLRSLFRIVCVHNMVNSILPARTGELSYVYLLKKVDGRTTGEGIATLVVARVFDFITITILFIISFSLMGEVPSFAMDLIQIAAVFMVTMVFVLFGLLYYGRSSLSLLEKILGVLHLNRSSPGIYVLKKCEETVECLERLGSTRKNLYLEVLFVSLGVWTIMYSLNYVLIAAMGIPMDFTAVLFASTFAIFTTVLPVQGVGGFGTLEAGWTVGFVAAGLAQDVAISSGFGYHVLLLVYIFILGGFELLNLSVTDKINL